MILEEDLTATSSDSATVSDKQPTIADNRGEGHPAHPAYHWAALIGALVLLVATCVYLLEYLSQPPQPTRPLSNIRVSTPPDVPDRLTASSSLSAHTIPLFRVPSLNQPNEWRTHTDRKTGFSIELPKMMTAGVGFHQFGILNGPSSWNRVGLSDAMVLDMTDLSNLRGSYKSNSVADAVSKITCSGSECSSGSPRYAPPTVISNVRLGGTIPATVVDVQEGQDGLAENIYTLVLLPTKHVLQIHTAWTAIHGAQYKALSDEILSTLKFIPVD